MKFWVIREKLIRASDFHWNDDPDVCLVGNHDTWEMRFVDRTINPYRMYYIAEAIAAELDMWEHCDVCMMNTIEEFIAKLRRY